MTNGDTGELIERFVEMLLDSQARRGFTIEQAIADVERLFARDDFQRSLLTRAAERVKRRVESIEMLRKPATLIGARKSWYAGPSEFDVYWPALKKYLREQKGWKEDVVDTVDESSSKVLSCVDFPGIHQFKTKGLVVGYVQSGKTANFTALISKAADVGFRVFLVLSGLTNALRKQTQERLDKELVSINSTRWHPWTDIARDIGDFPFNMDAMLSVADARYLAVVKKNGPRLRRMLRMFRSAQPNLRAQCPVMIIDDECDQASVNASGQAERVTAINKLLREILKELPRVAYIGYTATPFANVLIDPAYPDDLYPRDFIISLPRPDEYFGAERLFGRDLLDADEVPPQDAGLDMIRTVKEEETQNLRPATRDDKDSFALAITPSLGKAIRYYLMACAAKAARGLGNDHTCMLIHTTVYTQPHLFARPIIEQYIKNAVSLIEGGDAKFAEELRELWNEEVSRVPAALFNLKAVSFEEMSAHLPSSENLPKVVIENSRSDERLDFSAPGRRYVVVGGNVLARGLTIEGLVVSYFVRTASQYDTLMQMGRWFGYRQGYEDLPRIWMTSKMAGYFKDMATVEAEIRNDISVYQEEEITPLQFAVKVRQHPELDVTALGKRWSAEECNTSFAGRHPQTRKFLVDDESWLRKNWDAGSELINRVSSSAKAVSRGGSTVYREVHFTEIISFLNDYRMHAAHSQFESSRIIEYIKKQNAVDDGFLVRWNVCVVGADEIRRSEAPLGSLGRVPTVIRARLKGGADADIKALMSRRDATLDLEGEINEQLSWEQITAARASPSEKNRPLLLLYPIDKRSEPKVTTARKALGAVHDVLGVAFVFPRARKPTAISYLRAPLDDSSFELAEYEEEELPDDIDR
jgi:hypothetical protein